MRQARNPIWPFAHLLAGLLAMMLGALWLWQLIESGPAMGRDASPAVNAAAPLSVTTPRPAGTTKWRPAAPLQNKIKDLEEYVAPRKFTRPSPPVADRITLDPSLAQTPSLPTVEPRFGVNASPAEPASNRDSEPPATEAAPAKLARQGMQQAPDVATSWPYPRQLVAAIEELQEVQVETDWADRLLDNIRALHALESLGDRASGGVLVALQQLAEEGMTLVGRLPQLNDQAAMLRVVYGLQRRLAIWQSVHQLAIPTATQVSLRDYDASELTRKLYAVDQHLNRLNNAAAWRSYLLLDRLAELAAQKWSTNQDERSKLAREFLWRLESADSSREQEVFFAHRDWQDFADEMRQWVCEPVDYEQLLDDVERLEALTSEETSRDLTRHYQVLRWSSHPQVTELGERLNTYYRNANARVAISGELLNRLLPHPQTVEEKVNDTLMGGRIFGRSRVSTRLRLVLMPDRERWRLGLEAQGNVDSQTETKRGPARFHNAGRSRYLARKLLLIDRRGIRSEDAEAAATSNADLTGLETDLDSVPLVNLLVRAIARQQYDSQQEDVKWHAEGLLANRAESRLDQEVDAKLSEATLTFRSKIWRPLRDLGLRPEAVDMQTTEDRLIARYRLAGFDQAAAFTPRPQAPKDSLLSIQVHESLLNNTVSCLNLGGREVRLRDLFQEVATKLQRKNFQVPEEVPEDVTILLAEKDPITFRCVDDRIHVRLRITKLSSGDGHVWRDFEARGIYGPNVDALRVGLQRDSYVRLKGRRLSTGDQIVLRGIFAKVLAQNPDIDLLGNVLVRDERLHDLRVSQFVIRDGWIGLAVGVDDPVKAHIADHR